MSEKKMSEQPTYQSALSELKNIIEKIETAEPDIDEMNQMVKRATELILYCKEKLTNTEAELTEAMKKLED